MRSTEYILLSNHCKVKKPKWNYQKSVKGWKNTHHANNSHMVLGSHTNIRLIQTL